MKRAGRGSATFATNWQWLIGVPTLAFLLWVGSKYLSTSTENFLSGKTAFGALIVALITFLLTVALSFLVRLFIVPAALYIEEQERANAAAVALDEKVKPRIALDCAEVIKAPTESVRQISEAQFEISKGPSSKWVQVRVSCATDAPLIDCEVWLLSVRTADGPELVEEHIPCNWSQRESEPKITIPPILIQNANIFATYEGTAPFKIIPQTRPQKLRLRDAIQTPGVYTVKVLATAKDAPPKQGTYIFDYKDFDHMTFRPA